MYVTRPVGTRGGCGAGGVLVLVATRSSGDCVEQPGRPPTRTSTRPNTSHLRPSHRQHRGERIKQGDKIEKLLLRRKGRRWRHLALLRFVFVVDLLDLPAVDAQPTCGQDVLCHLVP